MSYAATVAPTSARRHAWIPVLIVGAGLFIAIERTLVATGNPDFVPSAILVGAAIVPATFLTFVYGRRLAYGVSLPVVSSAAFLRGVPRRCPRHGRRGYRTRADGLLIGVAAGAGFAALETMGYGFATLLASKGSITDTVDVLLLRGIMSPAGHMAWTGIAATALYAAAESGWTGRRIGAFVGAFVLAVALHTAWDSQASLIGTAIVAIVSLVALGWTVHRTAAARPSVTES